MLHFTAALILVALVVFLLIRRSASRGADGYPRSAGVPAGREEEVFLGLRQLAFCEMSLNSVASLLPQEDEVLASAGQAIREGRYEDAAAQLQRPEFGNGCEYPITYWFMLAAAMQRLGRIPEAIDAAAAVLNHPRQESRVLLQAYAVLRELEQEPAGGQANKVMGVVMEWGMRGVVILVAGYADGDARLLMSKGMNMIGEMTQYPEIVRASQRLCAAAKPHVSSLPRDESRQLPSDGMVRFYILTPGGAHVAEESERALHGTTNPLHELFVRTHDVLTGLRHLHESAERPS